MRPLRCVLGHDWGGGCLCARCGAPNHDFVPEGELHGCARCGVKEAHDFESGFRWVAAPSGAWDSSWGPYEDVEEEFRRCSSCGHTKLVGPTGRIGEGNR